MVGEVVAVGTGRGDPFAVIAGHLRRSDVIRPALATVLGEAYGHAAKGEAGHIHVVGAGTIFHRRGGQVGVSAARSEPCRPP